MDPNRKVKIEQGLTTPINDEDEIFLNNYNMELNKPKSKNYLL